MKLETLKQVHVITGSETFYLRLTNNKGSKETVTIGGGAYEKINNLINEEGQKEIDFDKVDGVITPKTAATNTKVK